MNIVFQKNYFLIQIFTNCLNYKQVFKKLICFTYQGHMMAEVVEGVFHHL